MTRVRSSLVIAAFATTVFGLILGARSASASYAPQSHADQVGRAEVIAYGTVTRAFELPFLPPSRRVQFRVERALKGIAPEEFAVAIGPADGAATSVDYQADDRTKQTLYLRRSGDGYVTDACSGSHLGALTAEETAMLGGGAMRTVLDHPSPSWVLPISIAALAGAGLLLVVVGRLRRRTRSGSG